VSAPPRAAALARAAAQRHCCAPQRVHALLRRRRGRRRHRRLPYLLQWRLLCARAQSRACSRRQDVARPRVQRAPPPACQGGASKAGDDGAGRAEWRSKPRSAKGKHQSAYPSSCPPQSSQSKPVDKVAIVASRDEDEWEYETTVRCLACDHGAGREIPKAGKVRAPLSLQVITNAHAQVSARRGGQCHHAKPQLGSAERGQGMGERAEALRPHAAAGAAS
jgi:hypothetical protein